MEYIKNIEWSNNSKSIIKSGQVNNKKESGKLLKKYKIIATISLICAILMVLDYMLVQKFITLLQTLN